MHIAMGYDGNQQKAVCDAGFRLADEIIKICSKMLPKQQNSIRLIRNEVAKFNP
jgi:hypothetical protein